MTIMNINCTEPNAVAAFMLARVKRGLPLTQTRWVAVYDETALNLFRLEAQEGLPDDLHYAEHPRGEA